MMEELATVAAVDLRVEPYDWIFAREQAVRIDAHWDALRLDNPSLFDGRVLLSHDLAIEPAAGGLLRGRCFETGYRSFSAGPLVALAKVARSPLDFEALQARFAAFRATQAEPELDRLVPVRDAHDFDSERMPAFMLRYLADALGA